jgi:hypothetical protein
MLRQFPDYVNRTWNGHGDLCDWNAGIKKGCSGVERLIGGAYAYAGENPDFLDTGLDFFPCHRAIPSFAWFE